MSWSVPRMTWANMSPPMVLVPKGWEREGGAFRVLVMLV